MRHQRGTAAVLLFLCACSSSPTESEKLHSLFDREWERRLREDPLFATSVGVHDYDDQLPSARLEDLNRRARLDQDDLDELRQIDRAGLDRVDQINYAIFERQLEDRLARRRFGDDLMPLNADSGFHSSLARLSDNVPLRTVKDYENYLSRMRAVPSYFKQQTDLMREGLSRGLTLPRAAMEGVEQTMLSHAVGKVGESVFFRPFEEFPSSVPEADQSRLALAAAEVIQISVAPAYRSLADFMTEEYLPGCRETLAATALPDGDAYYAWLIRRHTTLDRTAQQVHNLGLAEVDRIRGEMDKIIEQVGFAGDLGEFIEYLRGESRFYPKTPQELLERAAWIAKQADGKLPALFKTLPRLPYTVEPVPDSIAPKYTAGRYVSAPLGSVRPGIYWVNTFKLDSRPFYTLTALTLHEAVPGHHLQNALLQELEEIPNFRRFTGINAFGEGWGLYSEFLGVEAGMYQDPYEQFGRLTYEMWRACRLVVDTGIHAMGWTRRKAIDYLASNTALSLHECTTETDRYISWPGQALAYKIGELKIRELRSKAEEALGSNFDVREFHDAILLNGPVPLTVLEEQIDTYIENRSTGNR